MKERRYGGPESALRPRILHARIADGKVKAMGCRQLELARPAQASVHEPVPPKTTGIVRANT